MIITRTPYRISFFGGGTDYPEWFKEHGGSVLTTSINRYCYISCRYLPPFFEHKYRIVYSQMENTKNIEDIKHIAVRECLKFMKIKNGIEIHHDGDLPARSGIGSSSAFTVGLLQALYALKKQPIEKLQLAHAAIFVEQKKNKENVGSQDQTISSFGGLNKLSFKPNGEIQVQPLKLPLLKVKYLEEHLLLFFTGRSRCASEIAQHQLDNMQYRTSELHAMQKMVNEAVEILNGKTKNYTDFGKMLHETWNLKKCLSPKVSSAEIDAIYEKGIKAGAAGGKLLGAGGGGFILFFVHPNLRKKVKKALAHLIEVPFCFESNGCQVILNSSTQDNKEACNV